MKKDRMKKITLILPEDLLKKAQAFSKDGITETVRQGLELIVIQNAYRELLKMKGSHKGKDLDWKKLREEGE